MRAFSSREKNIFIACLVVLFTYGGYRFGYQAFQENTAVYQQRIAQAEKELRQYKGIARQEKDVQRKIAAYKDAFQQKSSDEQEMTKMLSEVEAAAQNTSMKIINMEPSRTRKGDFYNYFSINVQAQGSLKKIMEFLYALESQAYRFRVDEMRLEKYSLRADELKCQFVVSRFFILK